MSDPIRDELHKLSEEIKKLVSSTDDGFTFEKTTPEQLIRIFGLTIDEAKSWLENEPNFEPSDDSYHGSETDEKLPKPESIMKRGFPLSFFGIN